MSGSLPPPAVALLELASIARALRTGDAMVKRAEVSVLLAEPVSPGKYLILVTGGEAEVEEAWLAGKEDAQDALLDELYLPGVHGDVVDAIAGSTHPRSDTDSLGVVEAPTVAAAIRDADAACKEAPVRLLELRLGAGIGGKGVFTVAGELWDVQASLAVCVSPSELIARPDPAFVGRLR